MKKDVIQGSRSGCRDPGAEMILLDLPSYLSYINKRLYAAKTLKHDRRKLFCDGWYSVR